MGVEITISAQCDWNPRNEMRSSSACFRLLLLLLLLGCCCSPGSGSGKVIYFNQLNSSQSLEASKNTTDALGKSMLFDTRGNRCRHGFVRDHHGRCRRLV